MMNDDLDLDEFASSKQANLSSLKQKTNKVGKGFQAEEESKGNEFYEEANNALALAQGGMESDMSAQQIKTKKAFVWAFGKNAEGELSIGSTKDCLMPRYAVGMKGSNAKFIASSNNHTALVT